MLFLCIAPVDRESVGCRIMTIDIYRVTIVYHRTNDQYYNMNFLNYKIKVVHNSFKIYLHPGVSIHCTVGNVDRVRRRTHGVDYMARA